MKILWISHNLPYPPKGGVLQRNYNLLKQAAERHRICLVAFNQRRLLPSEAAVREAASALGRFCERVSVLPLPSDRHGMLRYGLAAASLLTATPYTVNWTRSSDMEMLLAKEIAAFGPDLAHFDTIGLAEYHGLFPDGPKVLNHHNVESAMMLRRSRKEKNPLKKAYFFQEAGKIRRYEDARCGLFRSNIMVSEDDRDLLAHRLPGLRTFVVPNGVDTAYFAPAGRKGRDRSLVFAGGMGWYPNRDAMLYFADAVWPLLKKEVPGIRMTVVGRDPPGRLRRLSARDPAFVVTGFVDDVRPFLDEAAVYVCPIRDGGGTRLKVLDALSMGKPIVATRLAAEGLKTVPGRHLLIADGPGETADAVAGLLSDGLLRDSLSREGRKLAVEEYDWSVVGKRLDAAYRESVGA